MRYVIIGGGPAATNAMETIRQYDAEGSIALVSNEPAHSRMALPYWLSGKISREQTHTANAATFQQLGVEAHLGHRVVKLDADQRQITLDNGHSIPFEKLFLATGSSPAKPSISGVDLPGVQSMWTLSDVELGRETCKQVDCPRIVFIGAGFVGMILVGALANTPCQVTVIEQADQILPRMLDAPAAAIAQQWLAKQDVDVITQAQVTGITAGQEGAKQVELADGQVIAADLVVLATGVRPNLQLVAETPIQTDLGILVDEHLQTNIEGIYAGGDCAQGPSLYDSKPVIHAIQPTAVDHGRIAGANMAGAEIAYPGSLAMNVVDIAGLQCISYGNWQTADDEVVIDNSRDFIYRRFVFRDNHLVGALFVGRPRDVGMLNDVGMVKGILQTRPKLESWQDYLQANPFDVRRPYIALGVPRQLANMTLLGRPSRPRIYRHQDAAPESTNSKAHKILIEAIKSARQE